MGALSRRAVLAAAPAAVTAGGLLVAVDPANANDSGMEALIAEAREIVSLTDAANAAGPAGEP